MKENVAYCDYSILRRKRNPVKEELNSRLTKVTSINDYVRNVNDLYHSNRVRTFVRSKKNKFEAIFSIFLHSLHYACSNSSIIPKRFRKIAHTLPEEIEYILRTEKPTSHLLESAHEFDPKFQNKISQLLSIFFYGDTELNVDFKIVDKKLLKNVEISYAALLLQLDNRHDFQHVLQWISSIMAQSVTDSYLSLSGLSNFPNVIIKDILLREPTSEYEFDLMLEFFYHYADSTSVFLVPLVENMVRSANRYKFTKLEEVITIVLTKKGNIEENTLNKLVCVLSDLGEGKNTREHYLNVLNAQRLVVDAILERKGTITPLGYLGIANGLVPLSAGRAGKFLNFAIDLGLATQSEIELASIVGLRLSKSPESLIQTFDSTVSSTSAANNPNIWKELFMNLEKFELLNRDNSNEFLGKIQSHEFAGARNELLSHLDLDHAISVSSSMNNKGLGIILDKLYRTDEKFEIFGEGYNYARHIFYNISSPSRPTVGVVLLGESFHNPKEAYNLYRRLLREHCDDIPSEKGLLSLLVPAFLDPSLLWENRCAAQIAVHEFRKHCKRTLDDVEGTLVPSNSLWKPYIKLLGRCNYQDELSEIMKLWEDLEITPERETLALLLASFPEGIGESKRRHAAKYLVSEQEPKEIHDVKDLSESPIWDWPEAHEVNHIRDLISRRY